MCIRKCIMSIYINVKMPERGEMKENGKIYKWGNM